MVQKTQAAWKSYKDGGCMVIRLGFSDFNEGGLKAVTVYRLLFPRVHTTFYQRSRGVKAAGYDKSAGHNNILGIDVSDKTQITCRCWIYASTVLYFWFGRAMVLAKVSRSPRGEPGDMSEFNEWIIWMNVIHRCIPSSLTSNVYLGHLILGCMSTSSSNS